MSRKIYGRPIATPINPAKYSGGAALPLDGKNGQFLAMQNGFPAWVDAPSGGSDASEICVVNVTGDIDNYTTDKTGVELVAAHKEGKMLVCQVNGSNLLYPFWVDAGPPEAVWFNGIFADRVVVVTVHTTGSVTMTMTAIQEAEKVGDLDDLTTEDKSSIVNAINEVAASGKDGTEYAITAKRFEAGENPNISPLDPRGGVELTIDKTVVDDEGNTSFEVYNEYIFDGYDGAPGADAEFPSGGTAGQVLTIAEDGSVVWADPTGGGTSTIPSAEGVGF